MSTSSARRARLASASSPRRGPGRRRDRRRPAAQPRRQRFGADPVGPRLRAQSGAGRPADPALGRTLVDPGGDPHPDRRRRQPRPPRRAGRQDGRRLHPPGRDRRALHGLARAAGFQRTPLGGPRREVAFCLAGRRAEQALAQPQHPLLGTIARHLTHSLCKRSPAAMVLARCKDASANRPIASTG